MNAPVQSLATDCDREHEPVWDPQDLIQAINHEYREARKSAWTSLDHLIECGQLLIEAKKLVGHGGWLAWV